MDKILRKVAYTFLINRLSIEKNREEYKKFNYLFDDAIKYLTYLYKETDSLSPDGWWELKNGKLVVEMKDGQLEFVGFHKVIHTKTKVLDVI